MEVETLPTAKQTIQNGGNKPMLPKVKDSVKDGNCVYVSAKQLFNIIQERKENILIIDCRSEKDYKESKLRYEPCVNVPEEIIREG